MPKRAARFKVVRVSHITKRNGDVYEKRLVRDLDGRTRILSKRIACGVSWAPQHPVERFEIVASNGGRAIPAYQAASKKKAEKPTARPKTYRRTMNHFSKKYEFGKFVNDIKNTVVETTSRTPEILKKAKARDGDHVLLFEQDFALLSQGLRSLDLAGVGGGSSGSVSLPIKRIQAQDRLRDFERQFPKSYKICKRLFIDGITPSKIPLTAAQKKNGGINKVIQKSVDDLAEFYNLPANMRKDRTLVERARSIDSYF